MRLLIISPSFYPATYYGGPVYSTYALAKTLKKQNFDVNVITTNVNGKARLKVKTGIFHKLEYDLPVKYYKSFDSRGTSLSMLFNLYKEIKSSDIVYLVSIFSASTPYTIFLCKLFKKPLIISPRGQLGKWCLEQGNPFKKLWLHLCIGSINQSPNQLFYWHLTSESEHQSVLSVYPSAKTFVIPNGVNEELFSFKDLPKNKFFYNKYTGYDCSDKIIIVSMGRLQKIKGFDILIESIRMINRSDVILLIAGEDFGEIQKLEGLIGNLGLRENVFLIGRIDRTEKVSFLSNADLFALASHHENFGMVYAEALAAGTPVVASRKTPWQDVEKVNCGLWVENTPEIFAEAINDILKSDPEQMGFNGRKYVRDNFSWDKIGNQFKEVINEII